MHNTRAGALPIAAAAYALEVLHPFLHVMAAFLSAAESMQANANK
jgi:hypothetical protein